MDKRILKQIAKEWCKGILLSNEASSFDSNLDEMLSQEEQNYIVIESHKIANRITKEDYSASLSKIVEKYYDFS